MKKVHFDTSFPTYDKEILDTIDLKQLYFKLGKYEYALQSFDKRLREYITDITKLNISHSIFSRKTTKSTEDIEGNNISEDILISSKDRVYDDSIMQEAINIFESYLTWDIKEELNIEDIKKLHKDTILPREAKRAGIFRKIEVEIPYSISFPESKKLNKLVSRFVEYINKEDTDIDPMIKSAFIHAIFVGIHPFFDGNGRMARLISDKWLSDKLGIDLYIAEAIYKKGNIDYHKALDYFMYERDPHPFIHFVLDAIDLQLDINLSIIEETSKKIEDYIDGLHNISHIKQKYVNTLAVIMVTNDISSKSIQDKLDVSRATAEKLLSTLVDNKYISKSGKLGRYLRYQIIK